MFNCFRRKRIRLKHAHQWGAWITELTTLEVMKVRQCKTCGFKEATRLRGSTLYEQMLGKVLEPSDDPIAIFKAKGLLGGNGG